jgi:protein-disulfide isomerase
MKLARQGETMVRKLVFLSLLAVCFTAGSMAVQSSDQVMGQILGGSLKSPVRIEVYSDFQCSSCRELYLQTIRQVLLEYSSKDKVCVIYHEYPIQSHQFSRQAARYVEAASRLGQQKLLLVMESLFIDQSIWSQNGNLEASIAKALSRDEMLKLKRFIQDASINASIDQQYQLAIKREIKSTPTIFFYYSGKQEKSEGYLSYPVMKQFIDRIIK